MSNLALGLESTVIYWIMDKQIINKWHLSSDLLYLFLRANIFFMQNVFDIEYFLLDMLKK